MLSVLQKKVLRMPKIYSRNQGGEDRYYGDFRDIDRGQCALIAPGSKKATTNVQQATRLFRQKLLDYDVEKPFSKEYRAGYVYFIQCKITRNVKIGFSADPERRLKYIQPNSPTKLSIAHSVRGTLETEWYTHIRYAEYRLHNEWFTEEALIDATTNT